MTWKFESAQQSFTSTAARWDSLNRLSHDHVLLDSRFVQALLRRFDSSQVLLGIQDVGTVQAMALVIRKAPGIWETFQPSQAPLGLLLKDSVQEPLQVLRGLLQSLPGPALQVGILQQDPEFSPVLPLPDSPEIELVEYIKTPRLTVAGTYEEYWKGRSGNLRHNLSRQRKRLAEKGSRLELVVCATPESMPDAMREYGRLESAGWKGAEGTAVVDGSAQGIFYRDLMEAFSATHEGMVYQLLLDGKVVASDLCLARNGMLVVLKTAYDETIPQISPALLMREDIIRRLYEEKTIKVIEFYGRVLDWHLKWTDEVRTMYHINCYRHSWVEKAKKVLKQLR
jgi:CelD/BcsL family acetyltransferase involved in cellulose biosynthesis